MSENLMDILNNPHFNHFAALLNVAMHPYWKQRHAEVPSVRETLGALGKLLHGDSFPESIRQEFISKWTMLLVRIVEADPRLHYYEEDMQWFFEVIFSEDAKLVMAMLFAVATSKQSWYTSEQVASATGQSASTWKDKAADGRFIGAWKAGKTWMFPALALRAQAVKIPMIVDEEEDIEFEEE